jgi:hypothetical protein
VGNGSYTLQRNSRFICGKIGNDRILRILHVARVPETTRWRFHFPCFDYLVSVSGTFPLPDRSSLRPPSSPSVFLPFIFLLLSLFSFLFIPSSLHPFIPSSLHPFIPSSLHPFFPQDVIDFRSVIFCCIQKRSLRPFHIFGYGSRAMK